MDLRNFEVHLLVCNLYKVYKHLVKKLTYNMNTILLKKHSILKASTSLTFILYVPIPLFFIRIFKTHTMILHNGLGGWLQDIECQAHFGPVQITLLGVILSNNLTPNPASPYRKIKPF
jgi:hypothetical protein